MPGRLAPTPSGHLHLGNALAFGAAWLSARAVGTTLLLRMEDLDRGRARPEIMESQREDLAWLGLDWDAEVPPQSLRSYSLAGLDVYRCDCPRRTRLAGQCACRDANKSEGACCFRVKPGGVAFVDRARGAQCWEPEADPVLQRADGEAAYPLAVVIDDHRDGVDQVVRGADLLEATAVQLQLYDAWGWRPPTWLHVPLLLGPDGRKLSKSHQSAELRALRAAGFGPERVWGALRPAFGLAPARSCRLWDLIEEFEAAKIPEGPFEVGEEGRLSVRGARA